ncbi:MmgE/PrpD family protein [Rhodococcus sp. 06-156-3C]|uniref:MmgE/PrpD family protein n=1 Tax=Nocardiaceae TaxID=85025 RepID=UPI0009B86AA6|nr:MULTISPECIES: MmgE/PrpD family protein [Rhodococcus]OZD13111.1 MmgE/PrpD family protein [Rhodococcus sp. 06-156-4a]OZD17980.1 MmgE/PrpD family protein [Rhodococcus sp. 06-156-3C]OZD20704.1 MmgE/PrpD family protein [Rhodococcus sp. 06-156-4C]OZD30576.1 MmgE/PrpD family protein [Rhodococcus sp. 06-156-3b]OZD32650.1 MmgE/PrpD family protein [Rhodococcus sp. 06-156-3]
MTTSTPPPRDLAADLADFVTGLSYADLGDAVVDATKANILDTLVCAVAGSTAPAVSEVRALVEEWAGTEQADAWVFGGRYPAHHAAWLNSAISHARDYDDTHDAAILHAGISCVPAAIAAAQLRGGISGKDLICSVAAGLEVITRLGTAVEVDIVESGFIYSSLLGYFGATAAAGRALGLDGLQMWDAFGIVYSSVAGNHQVTRDASLMKRLQPGLAAQAALVAVQLAARGVKGAREVFEGADGFNRIYLKNRVDVEIAREGLGARFELLNLSYKPYPCCRDTHSAIDAALEARGDATRPASDIARIRVGVTGPGYQMVCVPEAVRLAPSTIVEAQFSIPYTVAAAWIDGAVEMRHFTPEGIVRADVLELATKVAPYVDDEIHAEWHRFVTPARVIVEFTDGTTIESRVDYAKGHPKNPMTDGERLAKARDCMVFAARPLADDAADRLREVVARLDTLDDSSALTEVLVPVG